MKESGDNIVKSLRARIGQKSFVVGLAQRQRIEVNLRAPNLNLKADRPERTARTAIE